LKEPEQSSEPVSEAERTKAIESLQMSLKNIEVKLEARKVEDIRKRIEALKIKMANMELPPEVERGIINLANHLENGNHDEADKIQKKLIVDWPSQCSNWLVGIRQIVYELKSS